MTMSQRKQKQRIPLDPRGLKWLNDVPVENMGLKLLQKMGWKTGETIGFSNPTIQTPIIAKQKESIMAGLGCTVEASAKQSLFCIDAFDEILKKMNSNIKSDISVEEKLPSEGDLKKSHLNIMHVRSIDKILPAKDKKQSSKLAKDPYKKKIFQEGHKLLQKKEETFF